MPKQVPGKELHPGKQGGAGLVATENDLELIYQLAAAGKSLKVIALRLGISYTLMDIWMGNNSARKGDPRVRAAWEAGVAILEEQMDSTMMQVALDPTHRQFAPLHIWAQKVKLGRSEKRLVEVQETKKAPTKFKTTDISPEDEQQ